MEAHICRLHSLVKLPRTVITQIRHYKPRKIEEIRTRKIRNPSVSQMNARIIGVEEKREKTILDEPPLHPKNAPLEERPNYNEEPCYTYHSKIRVLEGAKQALWLTKSKMMAEEMPERLQLLADIVDMPNMEDEVLRSVKKCRIFDDPKSFKIHPERFSFTQLMAFLHLCTKITPQYPKLLQRSIGQDYHLSAPFQRGKDRIKIRGRSGSIITSKYPLLPLATDEEIQDTASFELESLHPIAGTIDLLPSNLYKWDKNSTGFFDGYPYPHANLLLVLNKNSWMPQHLDAQLIFYAFANCLVRANKQYGVHSEVEKLDSPFVTHAIGTNGRRWSFVSFQLNTTSLSSNDGIKNMVWLDSNCFLYQTITKKTLEVDTLDVNVFRKLLACYVDGAV
ncbi:large ribosomal subunit protein mL37-like [Saccoglossus kowalevskii]|uniref:Large ribosomal subunit protein mL37 n=1 Tax=Saccoglossus kowalevskii TaxID=10224 RepID=A0ABM0GS01_SACKO|nr:PREDICTED: 39S ribosomal protein L37, mitochondrial-like [Saccoglossus kowalevskii]